MREATPGSEPGTSEGEYVALRNDGEDPIDLSGWRVETDDSRAYRVPDGTVLDAGETLTIHSGPGADGPTDLYWGAENPVWGDRNTVTVLDAADELVLRESDER